MSESVKVIVRCRPMNKKQVQRDSKNVVVLNNQTHQIGLKKTSSINTTIKYFAYDYVFGQDSTQQEIYQQSSFSLVQNVLNGYNGTIFAYGQTGCGKTYTMLGVTTTLSTKRAQMITQNKVNLPVTVTSLRLEQSTMGIIPRAFHQIMTVTNSQQNKNHLIQCTFIQIYNEEIHDLLGKDIKAKINLQESPEGLSLKDLSVHLAKNISDMERYMEIGYKNRVIRETSMNKQSSRSHCIFSIRIQQSQFDQNRVQKFKVGKLNLVDLAGSERQNKTNLKDQGIKQAAKINLSLSALGNVISALVDGRKQHIPYRDSKLTRILSDSLGGNTKTVMIATISPSDYNYEQTLSTLRYSSRAKFIQNKPIINQDPKDALLRKYQEEIIRLKMILQGKLPYLRGNQTFYITHQLKQMNIFNKFPQLKNQKNQAIMSQMTQLQQNVDKINSLEAEEAQLDQNKQNAGIRTQNKQQLDAEALKKQLKFLQEIVKKQIDTSPQVVQELEKINELKQKLKQQALKQEKYKQEQKRRQEQLLNIEKNYKTLNQQVDSIKLKFQELRIKYVQTSEQLKDARQAHCKEKQDVLDALRIQQAENNKLMEILNVILPQQQINRLFQKCQWLQDNKQWVVPKFKYSQKTGLVFLKYGQKIQNLPTDKKGQTHLQSLQKQPKTTKLTNLIVEESGRNNSNRGKSIGQRLVKNQTKMNQRSSSIGQCQPLNSQRGSLQNLNLFQSADKTKKRKSSYYSDSNAQEEIKNRKQQNRIIQKYKLSLQQLPKIKIISQQRHQPKLSLDLDQIKNEIMKQIRQKNKMGLNSRKF